MVRDFDINKVRLFRYLDPAECRRILDATERILLEDGDVLFKAGDPGDEMYIIESGRIKIYKPIEDFNIVFAEFGPGDAFGEMSMIDGKPRSASAEAVGPCKLFALSGKEFRLMTENEPPLACKLLLAVAETFSERMRKTDKHLESYYLINKALITNEEFREFYRSVFT